MKRTILLLLCFGCLLLGSTGLADIRGANPVPDAVQTILDTQFAGWKIVTGYVYPETVGSPVLLVLARDASRTVVVLELRGDGYTTVCENPRIIPAGCDVSRVELGPYPDVPAVRIRIKHEGRELDLTAAHGEDGTWRVTSGRFKMDQNPNAYMGFSPANRGTALCLQRGDWGHAIWVPMAMDMTLQGFDSDATYALATDALADPMAPSMIPSTLEDDALPQPVLIPFPAGQSYPFYYGPGTEYMRKDFLPLWAPSDPWIQVFGREGDWLLVRIPIAENREMFGYISAEHLPEGIEVNELRFSNIPAMLYWDSVTEDPLRSGNRVGVTNPLPCIQLATLGEHTVYIEYIQPNGAPLRMFVGREFMEYENDLTL